MAARPWQRELYRRLRLSRRGRPGAGRGGRRGPPSPLVVTLAVALGVAAGVILLLEAKLRPLVEVAARTQLENAVTAAVEEAVTRELARSQVDYAALVTIQRDADGAITALSTDTAALNLLRSALVEQVLQAVEGVDLSVVEVPVGSLFASELFWGQGPAIQARALSVGTVSAEFDSDFSSAGVNQTLHRIWLEVTVPLTLLLPGSQVETEVATRVQIGETVIVGQVPGTYLQLPAA